MIISDLDPTSQAISERGPVTTYQIISDPDHTCQAITDPDPDT